MRGQATLSVLVGILFCASAFPTSTVSNSSSFTVKGLEGAGNSFNVVHGLPYRIELQQVPVGALFGAYLHVQPVARLSDIYQNVVDSDNSTTVSVTAPSESATLGGTTAVTVVQGIATFQKLSIEENGVFNISLHCVTCKSISTEVTMDSFVAATHKDVLVQPSTTVPGSSAVDEGGAAAGTPMSTSATQFATTTQPPTTTPPPTTAATLMNNGTNATISSTAAASTTHLNLTTVGRLFKCNSSMDCSSLLANDLPQPVQALASSTSTPLFAFFGEPGEFGGMVHQPANSVIRAFQGFPGVVENAHASGDKILMVGTFELGIVELHHHTLFPKKLGSQGLLQPACARAVVEVGNSILVGGCFKGTSKGVVVHGLANLTDSTFHNVSFGLRHVDNGIVSVPTVDHLHVLPSSSGNLGKVVIAGNFTGSNGDAASSLHGNLTISAETSRNVIMWDPNRHLFSPLNQGINGSISAIGHWTPPGQDDTFVILAGNFSMIHNASLSNIVHVSMGGGEVTQLGDVPCGTIHSILGDGRQLFIGGEFFPPYHSANILRYDHGISNWVDFDGGASSNGIVRELITYRGGS